MSGELQPTKILHLVLVKYFVKKSNASSSPFFPEKKLTIIGVFYQLSWNDQNPASRVEPSVILFGCGKNCGFCKITQIEMKIAKFLLENWINTGSMSTRLISPHMQSLSRDKVCYSYWSSLLYDEPCCLDLEASFFKGSW